MRSKIVLCLTIISALIFTTNAKAKVTDEDYIRLSNVFSDARISVMSDEEIENYLEYDLENADKETIYYKGVSHNNGSYTWTEVSEFEYEFGSMVSGGVQPNGTYVETTYKKLTIATMYNSSTGHYSFDLNLLWKAIPATRSFDVIAMRFSNISIYDGSQSGTQMYRNTGASSYSHVSYSPNGTNIVKLSNGFGISMNIVDNSINYLECSIDATGYATGSSPYVWGSYQHATSNVTLAQSQSYTLSNAGLGNVINFTTSVRPYYDGMSGVDKAL